MFGFNRPNSYCAIRLSLSTRLQNGLDIILRIIFTAILKNMSPSAPMTTESFTGKSDGPTQWIWPGHPAGEDPNKASSRRKNIGGFCVSPFLWTGMSLVFFYVTERKNGNIQKAKASGKHIHAPEGRQKSVRVLDWLAFVDFKTAAGTVEGLLYEKGDKKCWRRFDRPPCRQGGSSGSW